MFAGRLRLISAADMVLFLGHLPAVSTGALQETQEV